MDKYWFTNTKVLPLYTERGSEFERQRMTYISSEFLQIPDHIEYIW